MIWLITFLQKRPSDSTIRTWRIWFWLLYILAMYYNLIYLNKSLETIFFWIDISESRIQLIKYIFTFLWIIPLIMWITNICLLKSKYMRIIQIIFWIILFYISWKIVGSQTMDIDTLVLLMWFLPLFAWISWKCITTKCLKYKEKITKVRV